MAHLGELESSVEDEVQKAIVSGSVYVAGVFWNGRNQWNSYVKVVDCSLGKVVILTLGIMKSQSIYTDNSLLMVHDKPEREYTNFCRQSNHVERNSTTEARQLDPGSGV
jgi:hypothetical protein